MSENRYEKYKLLCDRLSEIAKEFNVVVITATQVGGGDYIPNIPHNQDVLRVITVDHIDLLMSVNKSR